MPARGQTAGAGIPPDVLINLSRDPDAFEEGIKRWTEAEANAREAQKEAAAAEQKANKALEILTKQQEEHETATAEHEKFVKQMDEAFEAEQKKLDGRKAELDGRQEGLDDRQEELDAQSGTLDEIKKQFVQFESALDERDRNLRAERTKVDNAAAAVANREDKLRNDLREFQDRIKGFGFS